MKKQFSIPIKIILLFGMVGLVLVTVLFITLSSYLSSRKVFLNHARDIMNNIASYTIDKSINHLQPAKDAAALTSALAHSEVVNRADMKEMESYFYEQLQLYPQFSSIYFANMRGEFIMASRNEKGSSVFFTKIISKSNGQRTVEFMNRNGDFSLKNRYFDENDEYDPRIRPWFIQAIQSDQLIWTDPYIFHTSQNPGITSAVSVSHSDGTLAGVVGVDIEIAEISDFISTLAIGQRGKAFILNSQGSIIAYPDKEKVRHEGGGSSVDSSSIRLTNINELDDAIGRRAYQEFRDSYEPSDSNQRRFLSFFYNGEYYHAMFTPFQVSRWPWTLVIYLPENDYIGLLKQNRTFNLIFSLAIAFLSSILGLIFARSISKPIKKLQRAADRAGRKELDEVVNIRSIYREIQITGNCFEKTRQALQSYQTEMEDLVASRTSELKRSNQELEDTIEELTHTQENLKRARIQAERANQAKSSFLATISHEIRTPLGGILGYAEMIEQTDNPGDVQNYVQTIISESNRLSRLLNSLLDLAKIEAEELTLEQEPLSLEPLAQSVILMIREKAKAKGIECDFQLDEEASPAVLGDSLRLSQILLNLLSNSVKFTHQGHVRLHISAEKGRDDRHKLIHFRIEDTGIGIASDKVSTIFQEYSQAENHTSRVYGGTGLGLPIANRLVHMMGGSLEVQSTPGKGSQFYFSLPMEISIEKKVPLEEDLSYWENKLKHKKVLVVDDSPTNRDIICFHLSKTECTFMVAEQGEQAVALAKKHPFDIVLMDIHMPEMDGIRATKEIRNMGLQIPIIGVTANSFHEDIQRYLKAGMNDCVTKPFSRRSLLRCMADLL